MSNRQFKTNPTDVLEAKAIVVENSHMLGGGMGGTTAQTVVLLGHGMCLQPKNRALLPSLCASFTAHSDWVHSRTWHRLAIL